MGKARDFFEQVVVPYRGGDCLFWPHARQRGHATLSRPGTGKPVRVCTLLCERNHGPKPTPLHEVRHLCGNGDKGCVTNNHVVWSTHKVNCSDRAWHGTEVRGVRNGQVKITPAQVRAIRRSKDPQRVIAARYGISQQHVSDIQTRQKWKHI